MHVRSDSSHQRSLAAQLISSAADGLTQSIENKKKKPGSVTAAAEQQIGPAPGGVAGAPPVIPADPEKSTQAKLRPEAPADRRFSPQTLDALIKSQARMDAAAQRILGDVDKDGDGAFSLTELKEALPGKSGEAPGRSGRAERLFNKIDADGDGKVTLAELTALLAPKPDEEVAEAETAEPTTDPDPSKITPAA